MSRLILNGDTTRTLGHFMPSPYVEKITLNGSSIEADPNSNFTIRTNFLVPTETEKVIYNSGVSDVQSAYKTQLEGLKYYVMYFYVNSYLASAYLSADPNFSDDPDGNYNLKMPIKYYDQIVNEELNPFKFYYENAETLNNSFGLYEVQLLEFNPLSSTDPDTAFDEFGNEYLNYIHDELVTPSNTIFGETAFNWNHADELRFITFATTESYEDIVNNGNVNDPRILNIVTGDISYETIYQDGTLGDPERVAFVDSEGEIYQQTPLMSIDSVPHKIASITHKQVVEKFQDLLSRYSKQYNTENGFEPLKRMMDTISNILETMSDSPAILPALQQLVPTFPSKTPSKPIGKFYKGFRSRIFTCNDSIKTGGILRRKLVYDSKIVDSREGGDVTNIGVDYLGGRIVDEINTYSSELQFTTGEVEEDGFSLGVSSDFYEEFIYTSHLIKEYKDNDVLTSNRVPEQFLTINYGNFFFDYEKALKKTSNISRVFNLTKLEQLGIPVPFRSFNTVLAIAERESLNEGVVRGDGYGKLISTFEDEGYPASLNVYTDQAGAFSDRPYLYISPYDVLTNSPDNTYTETPGATALTFDVLTGEQPYTPFVELAARYSRRTDLNDGFGSSLTVRAFSDPSNPAYGYGIAQSPIDDYRLMMFQLLDYVWNGNISDGEYGKYTAHIYIEDTTNSLLQLLISQFSDALASLEEYLSYATELCAFNNTTQKFNDFFLNEIETIYGSDSSSYPWILASVVYSIHLDIISDVYDGDMNKIRTRASELTLQISPSSGTLENLQALVDLMTEFYDQFYQEHVGAYEDRINHYYEDLIFMTGNVSETLENRTPDADSEEDEGDDYDDSGSEPETPGSGTDTDDTPGTGVGRGGVGLEIDDDEPVIGEGGLVVGDGGPGTYI